MSAFPIKATPLGASATAPPPGFMTLTIVGSGVSTGIPVIGHLNRGCACEDAVTNPNGPNNRNNISLLVTLPRNDLPTLPENERPAAAAGTAPSSNAEPVDEAKQPQKSGGPSHARFTVDQAGNYIHGKPVAHILIDCGKTFRDAYFKVMVRWNIRVVDTLLITHGHADAIAGLDDLRDLQTMHMISTGDWVVDSFIPTYLTTTTMETLQRAVDYIVRNSVESGPAMSTPAEHAAQLSACLAMRAEKTNAAATPSGEKEGGWRNIGIRRSTALDFFYLDETRPKRVHLPITAHVATGDGAGKPELPFFSFPVEHGAGYTSMAYVFGRGTAFKSQLRQDGVPTPPEGSCVVYISDVSNIPRESMQFLQDLVKIDVLFVDCLAPQKRTSPVHYCMDDVLALTLALRPRCVYGVGMHCEIEHNRSRTTLQQVLEGYVAFGELKEGEVERVDLAYDGMQITIPQ
jgi:phosphoribosyl 1,2-cyclic phosphodiesterase